MAIQVGDKVPQGTFKVFSGGMKEVSTSDLFDGQKVVLFAVPGAFTPTCSERHLPGFLEQAGLWAPVRRYLEAFHGQAATEQQSAYQALESRLLAAELPSDLRASLAGPIGELLEKAPFGLAVRSSAVCEDGAAASFAGIFESMLCRRSPASIDVAIRQCWCSLYAPRALRYALAADCYATSQPIPLRRPAAPDGSAGDLVLACGRRRPQRCGCNSRALVEHCRRR